MAVKQKNNRVDKLLDVAIDHNQKAYINLKRSVLVAAKELKRFYANSSGFMSVIDNVLRDFRLNDEKNVFIFNCYFVIQISKRKSINLMDYTFKLLILEII